MFSSLSRALFGSGKYHDHTGDNSYHSAKPHADWASPPLNSPCVVATEENRAVLSLYIEIVSAQNLSSAHDIAKVNDGVCDPYVKIKLAKPNKAKAKAKTDIDIHRTKFVARSNNPVFENAKHQSAFVIDGMPLEELQQAEGLLFKVKQHGTKEELGHVTVTVSQLLQMASGVGNTDQTTETTTLELLHPTKELPGLCGTIQIKVRPAQPHDLAYYKPRAMGYFQNYDKAQVQPERGPTNKDDKPKLPKLELESDASAEDGSHMDINPVKEEPTSSRPGVFGRISSLFTGSTTQQPLLVVKVNTMMQHQDSNSNTHVVGHPSSEDTVASTVASLAESPHLKPHHPEDGPLDFVKRMSARIMPNKLEEEIEKERIQLFHPFDEAEKAIEQERQKIFHHHDEAAGNGGASSSPINDPYQQGERDDATERARNQLCKCDNCNTCVIL